MAHTGLVLQGGGALGAFECGALLRLYEDPAFNPDVIAGVSIGAINAASLVGAKNDPIETLRLIWDRFMVRAPWFVPRQAQRFCALFGNPSFFSMRHDYLGSAFWTSFYTTDPLRRLLHETIDFDKLNDSPTTLVVSATNLRTGEVENFDNRTTRITAEHIIASGSLPPGFPMAEIGGESYWDGGLFNNTPLSPVIERLDPRPEVEKHLYVINLFPNVGAVPRSMPDVMDRMFELIFSNKLVKNVEMTRKVDEFIQALDEIEANLPPRDEGASDRPPGLPAIEAVQSHRESGGDRGRRARARVRAVRLLPTEHQQTNRGGIPRRGGPSGSRGRHPRREKENRVSADPVQHRDFQRELVDARRRRRRRLPTCATFRALPSSPLRRQIQHALCTCARESVVAAAKGGGRREAVC